MTVDELERTATVLAQARQLATIEPPRRFRRIAPPLFGIVALVVLLALAFLVASGPDTPRVIAVGQTPTTVRPASTAPPASTASIAPVNTAPVAPVSTAPPAPVSTPPPATTAPPAPAAPAAPVVVRSATYSGGKLYLNGSVPSQKVADEIIEAVGAVVGRSNVVSSYTVSAAAPPVTDMPMVMSDSVLFRPGRFEIPQGSPVIEFAVNLMRTHPNASLIVIGHTDSVGGEELNQRLSQSRADEIIKCMTDNGIDHARLTGIGMGGSEPVADNATPEGRSQNRRVEFIVKDLLALQR